MEHTSHGSGAPEAQRDRFGEDDGRSPVDALRSASSHFGELKSYFGYLISAKADQYKLTLRNIGIYAVLGIVGLFAGGAFVVLGVALLCLGIAHGLGAAFGRAWLGDLVAGGGILLLLCAAIGVGLWLVNRAMRKAMVKKYEQLQAQQRLDFGEDVRRRAAQERD